MKKYTFILIIFYLLPLTNFAQPPVSFTVNITSLPTCSTCCDGQACVSLPTGGCNGPYTYSWSTSNVGPIACEGSFCYNTTYFVKVYDICDTTKKFFTFPVYTVIKENKKTSPLKIFPNPVTNILNILEVDDEFINSEIVILNIFGQAISTMSYTNKIDLSKLTQNLYYLKIITKDNKVYHSKFIKK